MRFEITGARRRSRLMVGLLWVTLGLTLAWGGRATAQSAAEIEARMAERETALALREAELEAIADEMDDLAHAYEEEAEARAQEREARNREVEERLEQAQARLEDAARDVAELSAQLAGDAVVLSLRGLEQVGPRPMLGISIGLPPGRGTDGVLVMGVTPDGPADRAGLRSGDVIVSIDDVDLTGGEPGDSLRRLSVHMGDIEAGDEVLLNVRRDGADLAFVVTPEDMDPMAWFGGDWNFNPDELEGLEELRDLDLNGLPRTYRFHLGHSGRWGDMELVTLTPDLGQYFGTEEGLLVVRAPEHAGLALKDGDVILEIDGREPRSPGHAMRILRSYEAGETLSLEIVRQQRRQTLEVRVPGAEVGSIYRGDRGRRRPAGTGLEPETVDPIET